MFDEWITLSRLAGDCHVSQRCDRVDYLFKLFPLFSNLFLCFVWQYISKDLLKSFLHMKQFLVSLEMSLWFRLLSITFIRLIYKNIACSVGRGWGSSLNWRSFTTWTLVKIFIVWEIFKRDILGVRQFHILHKRNQHFQHSVRCYSFPRINL